MAQPRTSKTTQPKTFNNFQLLVRAISKYLKISHHLTHTNCLPNTKVPTRLQKVQRDLTQQILPAFPTENTRLFTSANASNWTFTSLQILEEHYHTTLTNTLTEIRSLPKDDWNAALKVATKWVRKDLPRVKAITITQATEKLQRQLNIDQHPQKPNSPTKRKAPTTFSPNPIPTKKPSFTITSTTPQSSSQSTSTPKRRLDEHDEYDLFNPTPNKKTPSNTHTSPTPRTPLHQSRPPPPTENWELEYNLDISPYVPLPQRLPRRLFVPTGPTEPDDLPNPGTSQVSGDPEAILSTHLFQSHNHNGDKINNWTLTPIRPILLIGDSNMSRLPHILDDRIQVDCYPGANLAHAKNLLRNNTPISEGISHVILSFGLNNREQRNPKIIKKDLQEMLNAANKVFPQALIYIPIINFSEDLPENQKSHIRTINYLIKETNHQIPRLAKDLFDTTQDNIHWTPQTAQNIWDHWKTFLD